MKKKTLVLAISLVLLICILGATLVACNKNPYDEENFVGNYAAKQGVNHVKIQNINLHDYTNGYGSEFIIRFENGGAWFLSLQEENGKPVRKPAWAAFDNPMDINVETHLNSIIDAINAGVYHDKDGIVLGNTKYNYASKNDKIADIDVWGYSVIEGLQYKTDSINDKGDTISVFLRYDMNIVGTIEKYDYMYMRVVYYGTVVDSTGKESTYSVDVSLAREN